MVVQEKGETLFMEKKTASAVMLTLLLTSLLTLAFNIQLVGAESGILYVNDNISGSSIERWSTSTMKSFLKNGLNTRLMDDFQLPLEVGGKWGFDNEVTWSDFAFTDDDSAELVIGLSDMRPNSYAELVDVIMSCGSKVVNTVSMNGKITAVVADIPLVARSTFASKVEIAGLSRYNEPNMRFKTDFVPNDPYWSMQWGPQKIKADYAWNTTIGNRSVLVAVIDTGIDWHHPDLDANYVPLGYDWVNNDTDPMDDYGHGTHCAGIIAAVLNNSIGVAGLAQVRIMAEKGLDQYGSGSEDDLANAIIHAVDKGANILSLSWGGYGESTLINEAVKYAYDHGALVIAAAGNDANECKHYPAAYEEVVAVTATNEGDNPASFTNFGDWVEVAAPGVNIYSTTPTYHVTLNDYGYAMNYDYLSGTSMACPQVAGVAALIWSQFQNMTRDQVRARLRYTADDLGNLGFDEYYGYGRVNARRAVEQALPEHDVALLYWKAPSVLKPFDTATINGTLLNFGTNNESNMTVQLLVNGSVAYSESIDFLARGASTTVSCIWSPTAEGKYNVTLYVAPVEGETLTGNNFLSKYVIVRYSKTIMVPNDFPRIQKAINELGIGYTIQVASGIYHEHVVADKSLELIGENVTTTVIDGDGAGVVVTAMEDSVSISGFTVRNSGHNVFDGGILLYSSNNSVNRNTVTNNNNGVLLQKGSGNNTIIGNIVSNNSGDGIWSFYSGENILRNNCINDNTWSFEVDGMDVSDYIQDIDTSNTIDGRPIYYWVNQHDEMVPTGAGYVAAVNCTRIDVKNLSLTNNGQGVLFAYTNNSVVANINVSHNVEGIDLRGSSHNTINGNMAVDNIIDILLYSHSNENSINDNTASEAMVGIDLSESSNNNTIRDNIVSENTLFLGFGIELEFSCENNVITRNTVRSNGVGISIVGLPCNNNSLYHNSFISNGQQVMLLGSHVNAWDDCYPSGGNYWSDYTDVDSYSGLYQNETGSDGIWDHPYIIGADNQDRYPLMKSYEGPHDIGVTNITTSETIIVQGDSLNINIKIINYGVETETFNVTVYANTTATATQTVTLTSRNSTTITFTWGTTGFAKGNYTIWAYAWPVPGETDIEDNTLTDGWIVVTVIGDINGDFKVDIKDLVLLIKSFGSYPNHPRWNANADVNGDGKVDIKDLVLVIKHFGEHYP
jgi:thermitase